MNFRLIKDGLIWGAVLWFIGYLLGFLFFAFVPTALIGWFIMPIGVASTLWILFSYIKATSFLYYFLLGTLWAALAVIFDYFFLVQLLKPADGYYKLDVYMYYALTFALPMSVYWIQRKKLTPSPTA